jgi:hypothetical protein
MSSMLDHHTPHLSLPARGHGEGGDQVFIAFCGVSCAPVQIAQGDALCLAGLSLHYDSPLALVRVGLALVWRW